MGNLFYNAVNMSVTGTVMIAAVMLLRLGLKRLPRRYSYALWIIPAVRLLCPVAMSSAISIFNLFGAPVNENRMEYIPSPEERVYSQSENVPEVSQISENFQPAETAGERVTAAVTENRERENVSKESETLTAVNENPEPVKEENSEGGFGNAANTAAVIWLCGAAAVLIWTFLSWEAVRRRIENAENAGEMYICDNIETPFVFGVIRPKIYVPRSISREDLRCVLAHERAHISRGDHIVKLLCIPITAIHWFNPFVWAGCRLMTDDMELSCDERALVSLGNEERKTYANALLNMSMRQSRISLGGALSFGESGIKGRIKGILSAKTPTKAAAAGAAAIIVGASVCLLTNAQNSDNIGFEIYASFDLISEDGVTWYDSPEIIAEFAEVFDGISPQKAAPPENEPENFLFSLSFWYGGSNATADSDRVRFFTEEEEDGSEQIYAQFVRSADMNYSYFTVTPEEFEKVYSIFSEYALHSFTGTVEGKADNEYTLVPDPLGGKPFIYFDFSDNYYSVSPDFLSGETGSVKVKSENTFQPGDRVRVTYAGNEFFDENSTVKIAEEARYYINVGNSFKKAAFSLGEEEGSQIWRRIGEFELTPAKSTDVFRGTGEELTDLFDYNTFYTFEIKEGERYIRITAPSPETDEMELTDEKPHRYIAVEKGYKDFRGIKAYYEIGDKDWEYLAKEVWGKYDKPFFPGTYKRVLPEDYDGLTEECRIVIDKGGNITIETKTKETAEVSIFNKSGEHAYGYKLTGGTTFRYMEYKGCGVIYYGEKLYSSFMNTAGGVYVCEELLPGAAAEDTARELSENTVVMSYSSKGRDENFMQSGNFYLGLDLPRGWTVKNPSRTEKTYLPELFSHVNIYDNSGEFAGTAAVGFFPEGADIEEDNAYLDVYSGLKGNWQDSYASLKREWFSESGAAEIDGRPAAMYMQDYPGGVYAVAEFKEGAVSPAECRAIAQSMLMYYYYDDESELIEDFVRYYYGGLSSGIFRPQMFTDNPQMREYTKLKLQYERRLNLPVGAEQIIFHAEPHYKNRGENQFGEEVYFYSLAFSLSSGYSETGFGGDFELVRKDGGWRIHRGLIYTVGDEAALGIDIIKPPRAPVEYDLRAGIEWLKENMDSTEAGGKPREAADGQGYESPEAAIKEYLNRQGIKTAAGVFEDEVETEKYRANHENSDNLTAVIAASYDFVGSYARYYIVETDPENGYIKIRDDLTYVTGNSVFVAQVTEKTAAGDLYIVKPYKGQPEGGRENEDYRPEIFVKCDLDLALGDSIVVCYPGEMTASAPAQIVQLWERRYTGEDFPTYSPVESSPARDNVSYVKLDRVMEAGHKDEYGGVSFSADDGYAIMAMDIPDYYEMSHNAADVNGAKAFEMGALWHAAEGFDPEGMKVDMVSGREITVYEEETASRGLYEYMLHSSVPDYYSDDGVYETYSYIVRRGEYMICISFVAEFYDKGIAEHILNSLEIAGFDPESINYSDIDFVVFYNSERGVAEGGIVNGSEYELAVLLNLVLTRLDDGGEYAAPEYIGPRTIAPVEAETVFIAPGEVYLFSENFGDDFRMLPGEYRLENTCWYTAVGGEYYNPRLSGKITAYFTVYE